MGNYTRYRPIAREIETLGNLSEIWQESYCCLCMQHTVVGRERKFGVPNDTCRHDGELSAIPLILSGHPKSESKPWRGW